MLRLDVKKLYRRQYTLRNEENKPTQEERKKRKNWNYNPTFTLSINQSIYPSPSESTTQMTAFVAVRIYNVNWPMLLPGKKKKTIRTKKVLSWEKKAEVNRKQQLHTHTHTIEKKRVSRLTGCLVGVEFVHVTRMITMYRKGRKTILSRKKNNFPFRSDFLSSLPSNRSMHHLLHLSRFSIVVSFPGWFNL